MTKRIVICMLAAVLGLSLASCRNKNGTDSAVQTSSVAETVNETTPDSASVSETNASAEDTTENKPNDQKTGSTTETMPDTYEYDEEGNVDIDQVSENPDPETPEETTPAPTEGESVDDAGNAIV